MTSTATGCITKAEELLRKTLAACTTFQTWVGATTPEDAAEHIYLEALPPDDIYTDRVELERLIARRPFAQIWTLENDGLTISRIAAPNTVTASGVLFIRFEQNVAPEIAHDYAEVDRVFKNTIGLILHSENESSPGLVELCGTAGYRDFETIVVKYWIRTTNEDLPTLGDAQFFEVEVRWGVSG
jgi:hypothetical protein